MDKIGLIAGNRNLPLVFAEAAKRQNNYLVAVAIKGETSASLARAVDKIYWIGINELNRAVEIFKAEGISRIIMAGQIRPNKLFNRKVCTNAEIKALFENIKDKKANTILGAIAEKLKESGLEVISSATFLEDLLPAKGTLTRVEPNFAEWEDIYFGWELAKRVVDLDIGQTVAVKSKAIVAVEALEGTDNLIRRAGRIAGSGSIIVKVSRPRQDLRFDIPVIGLNTIKNLIRAKARCLTIEAGKTLFLDRRASIELANKKNIAIVAV